jgi:hypothetical protein
MYCKGDKIVDTMAYFINKICCVTCMWSIYLSIDPIFQSLYSYQYFLDMVAANKDATKPRVTIGLVTWLAVTEYLCHK